MAPVSLGLQGWELSGLGGCTLFSLLVLFILTITLVSLCTICQRESFELQDSVKVERNSSRLVRVVKLEDVPGGKENPSANEIRRDETDLAPVQEVDPMDLTLAEDGTWFRPWRSHDGTAADGTTQISNGTPGATPVGSSLPQASADLGGQNGYAIHGLHPTPLSSTALEIATSLKSAAPTLKGHNQNGSIESGPRNTLGHMQNISLQHTYMTIADMKDLTPELSLKSHNELDSTAHQDSAQLLPYATLQPVMRDAMQRETQVPITLEDDMDISLGGNQTDVTYARLGKKIKCPTLPPVSPPDDDEESSAPPLPQRT